ncbi:MAG: CRISPR-associated helicase Cas3', partial [Rhodospirillaceae bacterium]|nr:CRISPR-associated helicase Cas3' [Rhodospirillaceae bacterium]
MKTMSPRPPISPETIDAWPGKVIQGAYHPALWHMLDVGAVADRLMAKRPVTGCAGKDSAITFLIALHDLGKISESFRDQITGAAARAEYHSQLSFVLLQHFDDLMAERVGGGPSARRALYAAVSGHHGGPPELDDGSGNKQRRWESAIGPEAFETVPEVIAAVAGLFPEASLDGLSAADAKRLSWKVSGLTVQADWIGSNMDWFVSQPPDIPIVSYWEKALCRARDAVAGAGLHGAELRDKAAILPESLVPRPMQEAVRRFGLPDGPVLAVVEDATGSGKTEAALILAHRMMTAGKSAGIFFALPTMATSNAMLKRVEKAAGKLFSGRPSLGLSHGRASLNEQFQKIRGNDGSDPGEPVTCGQWLADDRRRILLADIGVGTIDQALLAVLPTRFNTLRLWALSNKVLIVDEAHAYDPYMEEELRTLLRFHAMLGGSAIVMTATLPKGMRDGYAEAFQRGLGNRQPSAVEGNAYPQLTVVAQQVGTCQPDPVPSTCRDIAVERVDEAAALARILDGAREGAACVWVRNAVDDAIAAVRCLRAEGMDADLLHARFMVADRLRKEEALQERFGPDGTDRQGKVLVATQVVEASLDLDFDLMISDLAPIGSLIQRAGRLWRHMDCRPARKRPADGPKLHILSPDPCVVDDARWLHRVLDAGAWVYPLSDQWRTALAVFEAGAIRAPDGLRDLIEAVHGSDPEDVPEVLGRAEQENIGKLMIERQMARNQLLETHRNGSLQDYLHAAQRVYDEERLATRLGIPQVTLRIARYRDGRLEPLAERWEDSEVQMSRARYEALGELDQQKPEVAALKDQWPEWQRVVFQVAVVGEDGHLSDRLRYDAE